MSAGKSGEECLIGWERKWEEGKEKENATQRNEEENERNSRKEKEMQGKDLTSRIKM